MLPPLFLSVRVPTKLAICWRGLRPAASEGPCRPKTLSLLVVRLDGLGDVVLTTPLFRELKRAFPASSCTVVVQEAFRPLLVTNPNIDRIIGLRPLRAAWLPARARNLLSLLWLYWRQLRGRRFDIAISPRWDVDDRLATLLCVLVDATDRVGYSEAASPAKQRCNRGFDAAFNILLSAGAIQHEVLRNLEIVRALGGEVANSRLQISLTARDRRFASKLLTSVSTTDTLVAVGIGGCSAGRRWPLENYAETLTQLWKKRRMQPLIICSDDEWHDARKLAKLLPCEPIIVSGAPLRKVCALLEYCDLFLGNDCGSAHLAAAVNCKTVVISRHPSTGDPNHANSPIRFAPYCDRMRVLQPALGLDACDTACFSAGPHCITTISVEQVVAAAGEMLGSDLSGLTSIKTITSPLHSDGVLHSHDVRPAKTPAATVVLSNAAGASKIGRRGPASRL